MIEIDGAEGAGGGQILRSALTLAMVGGEPFVANNIRARRKNPGLQRQHLAAVLAAAQCCGARLEGAVLGSSRLKFWPGELRAGPARIDIGSAGSVTLVLQTIGPALALADGPSEIEVSGGTHNPMAPPFEFLRRTYAPLAGRMGFGWDLTLLRHGFYPAGGGRVAAAFAPGQIAGLELIERPRRFRMSAKVVVSRLPEHVAEREQSTLARLLRLPIEKVEIERAQADGPGNVVLVEAESETLTEIFASFGEKGRRSEDVAREAACAWQAYERAESPVGEHLADQLLLPMGLAAWKGCASIFRAVALSEHTASHIELLRKFLPVAIEVRDLPRDECEIRVTPGRAEPR